MKDIKIIGGLIAGPNWSHNIDKWLEKMDKCCDAFVIVDNSLGEYTDKLIAHPKTYYCLHQKRNTRYGGTDYTRIYRLAESIDADWVFILDADEELEDGITKEKLVKAIKNTNCDVLGFEIYEMWGDKEHYICHRTVARLWKVAPDLVFPPSPHSSAVPLNYKPGSHTGLRIKHFGHILPEYRKYKREHYFGKNPEYLDQKELESLWFNEEEAKKQIKKWENK